MKYIEVEPPHGFLIWRGKQTSVAARKMLPTDEPHLLVCNGEAYGKVTLAQPTAVNLSEFERLEKEHCIRPEERKMLWPGSNTFYLHRVKEIEPFSGSMPVNIVDDNAEFAEQPQLSQDEAQLVEQAEKLPKTIILSDTGLVLNHDTLELTNTVDYTKALQAYEAAVGTKEINGVLPLYRLALVRQPHLIIERRERLPIEKKQDDDEEGEMMPYKIQQNAGDCRGYAVVKETDGRVMGCHETREEAQAQLAALNIAEGEESKAAEAVVNEASVEAEETATDEKAVTKSEADGDHPASHYLVVENSQKPSTWHLRVRGMDGQPDHRLMGAAWAALHGGYRGNTYEGPGKQEALSKLTALYKREGLDTPGSKELDDKAGRRIKKTWKEKLQGVVETLKEMMTWADYTESPDEEQEEDKFLRGSSGFSIKQINGEPWFFAWSTNAFQDREQEIFSTKALEKYVAEAEKLDDRGFFNVWHISNTDFARKKWQGVVGRILVESGPFLDDDKGRAALKFFEQHPDNHPALAPEGWGMSPEYRYLPEDRDDKIYDWMWITRTSVLAKSAAANIYTKGGLTMALTDEQKQAAEAIFGAGLAAQIITEAETESKELEEAGVAHKSGEEQPETVEKQAEPEKAGVTVEAVVAELVKQLDLSQLTETVGQVAQQVAAVTARMDKLEKVEAVKMENDLPRYVLQLTRASQAEETKLNEGDALKEQKPKETKTDGSLAGSYFAPLNK